MAGRPACGCKYHRIQISFITNKRYWRRHIANSPCTSPHSPENQLHSTIAHVEIHLSSPSPKAIALEFSSKIILEIFTQRHCQRRVKHFPTEHIDTQPENQFNLPLSSLSQFTYIRESQKLRKMSNIVPYLLRPQKS
jgi:hypothetical protein